MEKVIRITENYLYIPIKTGKEEKLLEIFWTKEDVSVKIAEFFVPVDTTGVDATYDYYARFPVNIFTDKTLTLKGEVTEAFMDLIRNDGFVANEPLQCPSIHFTAECGWINDPNGLVYSKGLFHLYFQYNPFDTKWNNMSWGHAVSRDLLHWKQEDTVLFPDTEGMMFSGCGLVNERGLLGLPKDALLFFYTAAGGSTPWSNGKAFTQRLAYSLDDGKTLNKTATEVLPTICQENRDPKVFWHDESQAYIMCLWLEKNDFAIFRSADLTQWEQSDRFTLQDAWECPDLIKVKTVDGKEQWVFWTADGFYYFGDFDGYRFVTDGVQHKAYLNNIPYAAQTYSGVEGRAISISWLRTKQEGRLYTGAMALPRELVAVEWNGKQYLSQRLIPEMESIREKIYSKEDMPKGDALLGQSGPLQIDITLKSDVKTVCSWMICGKQVSYHPVKGELMIGQEEWKIDAGILDFSFVIDDDIFEVAINHGIIVGIFERMKERIRLEADLTNCDRLDVFRLD